jgi:N-acetyl-gamma-glutamyl-phosphate reductase
MRLSITLLLVSSLSVTTAFVQPQVRTGKTTSLALFGKPKVFIDGEAGTTGLQVRDRLSKRNDLEIISAPDALRKDEATRKKLINEADVVILCTSFSSRRFRWEVADATVY